MRTLLPVLVICALVSCGGSGLPSSQSLTVTVTPASATLAAGGTVNLSGTANGFTQAPLVTWGMQESHKGSGLVLACGQFPTSQESFTICPFGYVVYADQNTNPNPAVYHAPPTPGTYHVVFSALQIATFDSVTKTATATITVTQ